MARGTEHERQLLDASADRWSKPHSPGTIDGFEVFKDARSMHNYERSVDKEDEARFQAFLDSVSDHPDVQAWLASLDESAA